MRKGPNKVGFIGLLQPIADAVKLFSKEPRYPLLSNNLSFIFAPLLALFVALVLWLIYPNHQRTFFISFSLLFFITVSSLNVYCQLAAGWSSNSKYALLGALRGIAQTISYEVRIRVILLRLLVIQFCFDFTTMYRNSKCFYILSIMILFLCWYISILAETNRTPFDFREGESELVSGFNTEYSAGSFAFIFIAEYLNIILIRLITAVFFFSFIFKVKLYSDIILLFFTLIFSISFIFIRASLPRIRYDLLISLTWKGLLPFGLSRLIFFTIFIGF